MLIQRVITALVLLPLLLAAIWYLPPPGLYAVFCAAGLFAAWEWGGLMPQPTRALRTGFVMLCGLALAGAWWLRDYVIWFCLVATAWWLTAVVMVARYPENFERSRPGRLLMTLIGLVLLVPTMLALSALHAMQDGALRLLFLFFLIFAADTGAYLAGRNFGRNKLAPAVSPGKTVEGMAGGLLLCAAWGATAGTGVFQLSSLSEIGMIVLLSLVVAAISVVGDLTESMFKRTAGVKDSGHILPGHGGMLDRVDSLLAGAPVMALGLGLLQL